MQEVLSVEKLTKTYTSGSKKLTVLKDVSFAIGQGESLAIVGSSGSGKTTLLGLCAGLDTPSDGSVDLYGKSLHTLTEDERAAMRNDYVGFIFQNFQLVSTLTALENVMIPLELNGKPNPVAEGKRLLERVGLGDRYDHYPSQLSGGEQQRVSLARAFSNAPKLLFADEPTGNLDDDTSASIEDLLFELNRENGTTLVIVTHDQELAAKTGRIIRLKGGQIISDRQNQPSI